MTGRRPLTRSQQKGGQEGLLPGLFGPKKKKEEKCPTELEMEQNISPRFESFWNKKRGSPWDNQNIRHFKKSQKELKAIAFSQYIREQPDWALSINDKVVVSRWTAEYEQILYDRMEGCNSGGSNLEWSDFDSDSNSESDSDSDPEPDNNQIRGRRGVRMYHRRNQNEARRERIRRSLAKIPELTVKYVLAELKYYLKIKKGSLEVGAVDGTWQSDALISDSLRDDLLANVAFLEESIPENKKDWNDENQVVWNLLHPSMYCLAGGRSRVLKEPYWPTAEEEDNENDWSRLIHYHPDDALLSIEESQNLAFRKRPYAVHGFTQNMSRDYQWLPSEFKIGKRNAVRIESYINNLHPEQQPGLYSVIVSVFKQFIPLFNKVLTDLKEPRSRRVDLDQDEEFQAPKIEEKDKYYLASRNVQVFTKFTNIQLTPEKPEYPGGSFHSEGMSNEMIVASGIYYYSCENVTESRLEFEQANSGSEFWLQRREPGVERLGSIVTKQGRCIVFPNKLQHRVSPFKLEDPTRPGHRKILVFFLVDPTARVISTAYVPPQQKSWFVREIMKGPVCLPEEVIEMIVNKLSWPMSFKEALSHREGIIRERRDFDITYANFVLIPQRRRMD